MKNHPDLKSESEVYDSSPLDLITGELDVFDRGILDEVIRLQEMAFIVDAIRQNGSRLVLDYGCGPGWLSKRLTSEGFNCVGVDVSSVLCKAASTSSGGSSFLVGDCARLPFRENVFDSIVGVAILHHLEPEPALLESRRVTRAKAMGVFLEPNRSNMLTRVSNRFKILPTHTPGETPLWEAQIREATAKSGWRIHSISYHFPISFPTALMLRLIDKSQTNRRKRRLIRAIGRADRIAERLGPLNKFLGTTILVVCIHE
jgi:SAM-dependent methyltransferase